MSDDAAGPRDPAPESGAGDGPAWQNVTFASGDATAHGYLQLPPSGSGPGVVVVQEWWGLDDHVADLVRRLAAEGFVALAPDLYGGRVAHERDDAARMRRALPVQRAVRDLGGAVDHLLAHEAVTSTTVGVIGFCMGGGFVLLLAADQGERVSAAVPFYGVPPQGSDLSGVRAQVQGHFAERDRSVSREDVVALTTNLRLEAGVEAHVHWYPAGHAFLNDTRPSYDRHQAALAWSRAVEFLRDHVR
ncbi:dienelactone hydrolase family protein [Thalassiella azotivora]